jgi:hypothetical protein
MVLSSPRQGYLDLPIEEFHLLYTRQCCRSGYIQPGSGYGSRSSISSESGSRVLVTKNFGKNTAELCFKSFFDQKLQFTYPWASIKDVQTTGESFSSQKRTSSTTKDVIYNIFSIFLGHFALLDPDPWTPLNLDPIRIRIRVRIPNTGTNTVCTKWRPHLQLLHSHKGFVLFLYCSITRRCKNCIALDTG